eukprot:GAHX01001550.1.p1 GENE.GAHX01001550.1~~GAHX01001550.1.p1  ORF type:complete len:451 (-),score=99.40 GAHX01001550.1:1364-2668(-)
MGVIKYKMNNISTDWESLKFPGGVITQSLLKKKLLQLPSFSSGNESLDFIIEENETNRFFSDSNEEIENGTFLLIRRVYPNLKPLNEENNKTSEEATIEETKIGLESLESIFKTSTLPPGYICFKCNQPGHFIKDCPLNVHNTHKESESNAPSKNTFGELSKTKTLKTQKFFLMFVRPQYSFLDEAKYIDEETLKLLPKSLDDRLNVEPEQKTVTKENEKPQETPKEANKTEVESNTIKNNKNVPFQIECPLCRNQPIVATYVTCCMYTYCFNCIDRYLGKFKECFVCKTTASKCNLKTNMAIRTCLSSKKQHELNISKFDYFKPPQKILQDSEFLVKFVKAPKEMQPFVRPNIYSDVNYEEEYEEGYNKIIKRDRGYSNANRDNRDDNRGYNRGHRDNRDNRGFRTDREDDRDGRYNERNRRYDDRERYDRRR